jgi:hypothetical protein
MTKQSMRFVQRVSKWIDDLIHPKKVCKKCGVEKRCTLFQEARGYDHRGRCIARIPSGICLECWPEVAKATMNMILKRS